MAKRAFDLLFAAGALLLIAPLLLAVTAWIKLDSRGPVLFRQVRVGRAGREFHILKFRTMHVDAPSRGPQITVGRDPRITRSGHFLRKYKLDELPQFFNVLVGDMSVVGPRPEVPRYVAMYPPSTRELVLSVRPGITDLASIEYRDENELLGRSADPERTYVEQVMPAKLSFCERYVRERSFAGDLGIIGRTFVAAFARR
ncbi:MAG: sugar transferase [Piscinibacter sp.]|uniref:sugar transferase n=1 Tax=Piscinibacter sp. TaxID=1903157 RepID=UPI003D1282EC